MQLSPHFSLAELTASQTAARKGLDNTPTQAAMKNLKTTCEQLEAVRELLGHPLIISSGYRSTAVNKAVGGAANSAHVNGWAVDFICPGYGSPVKILDAIKVSTIKLDQCIEEGTWIHISFAPTYRQQFMKARFKNGRATYTVI